MYSDKLFPGSHLVSSIEYFESTLPFVLIYACSNDVFLPVKACLSYSRSRTTDMMYVKMASGTSLNFCIKLTLKIHLVMVDFILRYYD